MKKKIHKTTENMEDDGYGKCYECRKRGSDECPPSSKCLKFDDRPYFEPRPKEKFTIRKVINEMGWDGIFLSLVLLILILMTFVAFLMDL